MVRAKINRKPKQRSRPVQRRRKTRIIRPRMRVSTIPAAVNTATTIRSNQPSRVHQTNTDRLIQSTIPVRFERGNIVIDQLVTANITDRLRTQASLFQRIKYRRLTFEIQTQTSTTTTGGYAVAFLKDPMMEIGTGTSALKKLTAVQGSKTSKWWQSTVLDVIPNQMQYYCANGTDLRWYSPGRLVILGDGPPNEEVNITIILKWVVELTEPAMQAIPATYPKATLTASCLKYQSGTDGGSDGRLRAFNVDPKGVETEVDIENAFSGLPTHNVFENIHNVYYQLPFPIVQSSGAIAAESVLSYRFLIFSLSNDTNKIHVWLNETPIAGDNTAVFSESTFILWRGDSITPIASSEFLINADDSSQGFWIANQSPSVNNQLMISKKYYPSKQIEQLSQSTTDHNQLRQLFHNLQLN